jgi:hypothetical protein
MVNARKIEAIKWDWNPLWHTFSHDKCLATTERLELPWLHSFKEVEIITCYFLRRKTPFKSVPWEVQLVKVFFWHSPNNDVSYACPLQGGNNESIKKMRMGGISLSLAKSSKMVIFYSKDKKFKKIFVIRI